MILRLALFPGSGVDLVSQSDPTLPKSSLETIPEALDRVVPNCGGNLMFPVRPKI